MPARIAFCAEGIAGLISLWLWADQSHSFLGAAIAGLLLAIFAILFFMSELNDDMTDRLSWIGLIMAMLVFVSLLTRIDPSGSHVHVRH